MPAGQGTYDSLCTTVRVLSKARAVVLIVLDGANGSGVAVQQHEAPMPPRELAARLQLIVEELLAIPPGEV